MTYSLELYFEPALRRSRIFQYFGARRHFTAEKDDITYGNPDTGVHFFMTLRGSRNFLCQRTVASAEFVVNYLRPTYFGIEAERELSAFMAAFRPRIDDAQMHGMGEGPYSGEGFLKGWAFGNVFAVHSLLPQAPADEIATMPGDVLLAAWEWNYRRDERRRRLARRHFVPTITFYVVEGRPSRVAVWPLGDPVSLPRVDYVLVGRIVSGEKRFGLAQWSEVQKVVERAGFDPAMDPLDLEYFVTPPPIANWVANIPLIESAVLKRLRPHQILDDELIEAARESFATGSNDS